MVSFELQVVDVTEVVVMATVLQPNTILAEDVQTEVATDDAAAVAMDTVVAADWLLAQNDPEETIDEGRDMTGKDNGTAEFELPIPGFKKPTGTGENTESMLLGGVQMFGEEISELSDGDLSCELMDKEVRIKCFERQGFLCHSC